MKKLFTLFLALVASSSILHAAIVNGICGENLTWSLNTKDSTLTIEGTGEMSYESSAPWSEYRLYIAHVSLPEGLTNINNLAFSSCSNLAYVDIPNTVTSIGQSAFSSCGLTEVTIPNSVNEIGRYAFQDCSKMKTVTIGNGVKNMELYAFYNCYQLSDVYISDIAAWCNINFNGDSSNPIGASGTTGRTVYRNLYLNNELISNLVIPEGVNTIKSKTFANCYSITSVNIPNSVQTIGTAAFFCCPNLESVTIGNGISSFGNYSTFLECNKLTCLIIFATTPPANGKASNLAAEKCTLYVPVDALDTYANTIWWEDFKEIKPICIVMFKDWNDNILSRDTVLAETAATPPTNPTREGYTFTGWDKDFSNVTENMTVTAQYQINQYRVEFRDWNGTLLKEENVEYNSSAAAPSDPSRDWYTFIGWDKDFSVITSDLVVTAQYKEGQIRDYTLLFSQSPDNSEIASKNISMEIPAPPVITGYTFVKWVIVGCDLDDTIEIQAIYVADDPTSAPEVYTNPSNSAQKLIRNDNIYILTDDNTYTITGLKIR